MKTAYIKKVRNNKPPKKNHAWRYGLPIGKWAHKYEDELKIKTDMDFIQGICKDSIANSL